MTRKEAIIEAFPRLLSDRIIPVHIGHREFKPIEKSNLLYDSFNWYTSIEGWHFWKGIWDLYFLYDNPTEEQILEVFTKHNIEP